MEKTELFKRINAGIADERLRVFSRNLKKNLPEIKRHGGLRSVVPLISGCDILVVGAGSSLDAVIPLIKRIPSEKMPVIIAADMAFRPLMLNGIVPRFVICCETTPKDYFSGIDSSNSHLLAFSCIRPSTLRQWKGRVSFYNWMVRGAYDRLWEKAGSDLGYLATGSTVLTQALSLALGVPLSSLCTVGNDLGYRYAFYARGTVAELAVRMTSCRIAPFETQYADKIRGARQYVVKKGGRDYFTHHQFLAAKYWIEDLFAKSQVTLLESSLPGAAGANILNIPFEKYLKYLEEK